MCLTCGCHQPSAQHSDPAHITIEALDAAARASGISREQAWRNMADTLAQDVPGAAGWIQRVTAAHLAKVDEGAVGDYKARHLIRWFNEGADGRIPWGAPGDLTACHRIAAQHMSPDKAWGFCNNRHHDVLGTWNSPKD